MMIKDKRCNDNNILVLFNFVLYFLFMRVNGKQLVYDYCRKNVFIGILLIELYIFFVKRVLYYFLLIMFVFLEVNLQLIMNCLLWVLKNFVLMFDRMKKINILLFFYKVNFVMKMMIIVQVIFINEYILISD